MAVTVADVIDPAEEPVIRQVRPRAFDAAAVDPAKVVVSYDRRSDTLLVHLCEREREAVSVQADRYLHWLVDPDTEEVLGFHVEAFLACAVKDLPETINMLDHAELRGITPAEVQALRRDALGHRQRLATWLRSAFVRTPQERKRRALTSFMDAERSSLRLSAPSAA